MLECLHSVQGLGAGGGVAKYGERNVNTGVGLMRRGWEQSCNTSEQRKEVKR